MWQRFSEEARRMVFYSQQAAETYGDGFVSTEHLLLGLIREPDCAGSKLLVELGLNLDDLRLEIQRRLRDPNPQSVRDMTLTPRGKLVIDFAFNESREIGDGFIGTEHLALGLIRTLDGTAGKVLAEFGIAIDSARAALRASRLRGGPTESVGPATASKFGLRQLLHVLSEAARNRKSSKRQTESVEDQENGEGAEKFGPWARYDDEARDAIYFASEEARKYGEGVVSTEYLILGLLREPEGAARRVLETLSVDADAIVAEVEQKLSPTSTAPAPDMDLTMTPPAMRVVDLAYTESRALNAPLIGAEHLLLALLRERDNFACRVLMKHGADLEKARRVVARER